MMMLRFVCCLLIGVCFVMIQDSGEPGQAQVAETAEFSIPVRMKYLVSLPDEYESKKKWPLVLFLHGAGERGTNIDKVKVHGPPKLIEAGKKFPFVTISPQCPGGRWWDTTELMGLLDHVQQKYRIDKDRIYVTGLSMGGFGTWSLAARAPNRFAAIAPICGGGDPMWARGIAHIPTWAFHGARDRVVPVERTKSMVDAIKTRNPGVKVTIYPDANHDSWTATYENPKFYEWLLSHSRATTERSR